MYTGSHGLLSQECAGRGDLICIHATFYVHVEQEPCDFRQFRCQDPLGSGAASALSAISRMADELTTGRTIAADFPQQLVNRVETGGIRFIDVRTPAEWKISRIEGAEHLPLPDILENHFPEAGKMESLVLQCGSGYRSDIAASVLRQKGYTNVTPLAGGDVRLVQRGVSCGCRLTWMRAI